MSTEISKEEEEENTPKKANITTQGASAGCAGLRKKWKKSSRPHILIPSASTMTTKDSKQSQSQYQDRPCRQQTRNSDSTGNLATVDDWVQKSYNETMASLGLAGDSSAPGGQRPFFMSLFDGGSSSESDDSSDSDDNDDGDYDPEGTRGNETEKERKSRALRDMAKLRRQLFRSFAPSCPFQDAFKLESAMSSLDLSPPDLIPSTTGATIIARNGTPQDTGFPRERKRSMSTGICSRPDLIPSKTLTRSSSFPSEPSRSRTVSSEDVALTSAQGIAGAEPDHKKT